MKRETIRSEQPRTCDRDPTVVVARLLLGLILVGCRANPHVVTVRANQWCPAEFADFRPHAIAGGDEYLLDTGATLTRLPAGVPCPDDAELDLCTVVIKGPLCGSDSLQHIVGGDTLADLALSFDVTNGAWTVSSEWELEPANPPVSLGCALPFVDTAPGGRAFVTIDVEGTSGEFLIDTGSEHTMIRQAQFDALVADGRPQKPIEINTAYGTRTGVVTTSDEVSPCGASRHIMVGTGIDDLLDGFDIPAGKTLAGILGSSYLIEARTVIDYPGGQARIYFRQ
jgi:hypothetical protein